MWARKCGAPGRWPSWCRILIQSFMSGTIGLVVFQFMNSISESNLALGSGRNTTVTCVTSWLRRSDAHSPLRWDSLKEYATDAARYIEDHKCQPATAVVASCLDVSIPVRAIKGDLGFPFGGDGEVTISDDVLYMYSYLFLLLGMGNLAGFLVHDWALIHVVNKNFVLDWNGLHLNYPILRKLWLLTGVNCLKRCFTAPGRTRKVSALLCGILFTPVVIAWSCVVFLGVLTPTIALIFIRHPIRMSRFWTFILLNATSFYGLIMTVNMLVYLGKPLDRPRYAIIWDVPAAGGSEVEMCECGCTYAISGETISRLVFVGIGLIVKTILSTLRCLKGLRRSQWANLLSVMFPVPVGVYAVTWVASDGGPIRHRKWGEPVQSEQAFDPFALMDEQPESRYTTLTLKPEFAYSVDESGRWKPNELDRELAAPALPQLKAGEVHMQPTEYIGCCGFPCLTGGYQAVIASDSEDDEFDNLQGELRLPGNAQPDLPRVDTLNSDGTVKGVGTGEEEDGSPNTRSPASGRRARGYTTDTVATAHRRRARTAHKMLTLCAARAVLDDDGVEPPSVRSTSSGHNPGKDWCTPGDRARAESTCFGREFSEKPGDARRPNSPMTPNDSGKVKKQAKIASNNASNGHAGDSEYIVGV
eukprot:TRINITY_DN20539_c0_g3_i1.p1 TRINITY_DN20539_c0_g3~~TRINITY_DN20539_c0_g3_i1.p1  ORF type:complete len:644 (+),score=99.21 TRINITY_DN20539_c0_g3_i1:63-1994(+)